MRYHVILRLIKGARTHLDKTVTVRAESGDEAAAKAIAKVTAGKDGTPICQVIGVLPAPPVKQNPIKIDKPVKTKLSDRKAKLKVGA